MENLVANLDILSSYKGKNVFVTGHTGFKGTWLTAILYKLGAIVKGYSLAPESSKPFYDLFDFFHTHNSVIADVRDRQRLQEELLAFQPDLVFHLAAQPLVLRSYQIPAETFDVNQDILKGFNFYSEGYYEVPYVEELKYDASKLQNTEQPGFARFETILPDKAYRGHKVEYYMKEAEIIVSGDEETREDSNIFKIPSEWVNTPHLSIKFNKTDGKFYLASFGEKTIVNEKEVQRSDPHSPSWIELPINSRMILNGIIGINIFKS